MKKNKKLIEPLSSLINVIGNELSEEEREYILLNETEGKTRIGSPEYQKDILSAATTKLFDGWMALALNGYEFIDSSRIKDKFGSSLKDRYLGASNSFLSFAKGYWTFVILLDDLRDDSNECAALAILSQIELNIASMFFPTPGPFPKILYTEKNQRRLLNRFNIDIDDFMKGSPVLQRNLSTNEGKSVSPVSTIIILIIAVIVLILIFKKV